MHWDNRFTDFMTYVPISISIVDTMHGISSCLVDIQLFIFVLFLVILGMFAVVTGKLLYQRSEVQAYEWVFIASAVIHKNFVVPTVALMIHIDSQTCSVEI